MSKFIRPRVIPCLLLDGSRLVKTIKFQRKIYLGDPINAVKIFNEKEVDELILLDIGATVENRQIQFDLIENITSESFMPLCYGGGVHSLEAMDRLFNIGIEKIALNSQAVENPGFVRTAAKKFGSQSVVVSIDVKRHLLRRHEVFTRRGRKPTGCDPVKLAVKMEESGAGEILLNSIDRDGRMAGYDLELIRRVSQAVKVPVIACGGARDLNDLVSAVQVGHASSAAAGSLFVFHGNQNAVLINFPDAEELDRLFQKDGTS